MFTKEEILLINSILSGITFKAIPNGKEANSYNLTKSILIKISEYLKNEDSNGSKKQG